MFTIVLISGYSLLNNVSSRVAW